MSVKELTKLTIADLWRECNNFSDFWDTYDREMMKVKKRFIEAALEAERTMLIGCKPHERTDNRRDYRNGHWKRFITLKGGRLEINMPRLRGITYESAVIPRYKQRSKEVDEVLLKIFLYGASTRLTGSALRPLLGDGVSAQTISNIARSLDGEIRRYHSRVLEDRYLYLLLDGIVLKRKTGFGAKKRVVLVAYGIGVDGKRQLIDFMITNAESEKMWWRFLNNLYRRGLVGETLGLVVTDGNSGLENAVDLVYPLVKRQRCWAHKLRNVANYLRKKDQKECIDEARAIYSASSRKEAEIAYER